MTHTLILCDIHPSLHCKEALFTYSIIQHKTTSSDITLLFFFFLNLVTAGKTSHLDNK